MSKCTTYKSTKGKDVAVSSLLSKCERVLCSDDVTSSTELFRQICGTVFYISLFHLPAEELKDGYRYTLESIVESIEGFMRDDAKNWLNNITDCSSEYAILGPHLEHILHEATIQEICSQLGIPVLPFYLAAMRMYLFTNADPFPKDALEIIRKPNVDFYEVWNMFEDCIYRKGDKYAKYSRGEDS